MKRVAVVVCTRDRPAMLERALASLQEHLRREDEPVVVDSASTNRSVGEIGARAGFPVVRVERPGLSIARNAGVAATTAPVIAFTDDDCMITEGWTAAIERCFADPAVGFMGGRVVADADVNLPITVEGAEPRRFTTATATDPEECGTGANMAFRRDALTAIGGFDELLGAGSGLRAGEDHDAFWRALAAGWTGAYEPDAVVVHTQWRTRGQAIRLHYGYGLGGGAFAVKAIRMRSPGGWRLLRARLWSDGVAQTFRDLLGGYESGAVAGVLRTAGVVAGAARASRLILRDGRFTASPARRDAGRSGRS